MHLAKMHKQQQQKRIPPIAPTKISAIAPSEKPLESEDVIEMSEARPTGPCLTFCTDIILSFVICSKLAVSIVEILFSTASVVSKTNVAIGIPRTDFPISNAIRISTSSILCK